MLNRSYDSEVTMSLQWSNESLVRGDRVFKGALTELGNAVLGIFWVGENPKMGTLTVTMPDGTSSPILGERDEVISRIIGERLASVKKKLALVSVNLPPDTEDGKLLMELTKRLMGETDE
jgi:hypothetical protein